MSFFFITYCVQTQKLVYGLSKSTDINQTGDTVIQVEKKQTTKKLATLLKSILQSEFFLGNVNIPTHTVFIFTCIKFAWIMLFHGVICCHTEPIVE